jgi:small-conductance mechanosensitive channel
LAVWINDPENGQGNLTSALNLGIWKAFAKHGIKTSYPQREVRVLATAPGTTPQADPKTQI